LALDIDRWSVFADQLLVLIALSTGFDLLLQSLKLPEGSEVLVSGVEIADMLYVLRYHGLVPVPVDVKADTLGINADLIEDKITPVRRNYCGHQCQCGRASNMLVLL